MKRTLFQLINLLMACVVLLSSTGFGLVEHTCQMRGNKKTVVVAFSEVQSQGCASDQNPRSAGPTVLKKTECCQDQQHFENVDISSSLSQIVAKVVKNVTEAVIAGVTVMITWLADWIFAEESTSVAAFVSPPSPSGRDILTLVSSLLL